VLSDGGAATALALVSHSVFSHYPSLRRSCSQKEPSQLVHKLLLWPCSQMEEPPRLLQSFFRRPFCFFSSPTTSSPGLQEIHFFGGVQRVSKPKAPHHQCRWQRTHRDPSGTLMKAWHRRGWGQCSMCIWPCAFAFEQMKEGGVGPGDEGRRCAKVHRKETMTFQN
jgi:hypothetical protein